MVRLQKKGKQEAEGKKSFNLQVPVSVWGHWDKYCKQIERTPTEAINLLIRMELQEAMEQGLMPKDEKIYVDLIVEEKKPKRGKKTKQTTTDISVDTDT